MKGRRPGSGVQAWRRRQAAIERSVDAAVAAVKAEKAAAWEAARAEKRAFDAERALLPAVEVPAEGVCAVEHRDGTVGMVLRRNPKTVVVRVRGGDARWPRVDIVKAVSRA